MKSENSNIRSSVLERVNRRDGMTVPDDFFQAFATRLEATLPLRPEAETPAREIMQAQRTLWGRIRPYVYMAAMFAGIWCMLKMFTLMTGPGVDLSVDNNRVLTEALSDENFVYDYIGSQINDRELFDEMYDDSISIDDMVPVEELVNEDSVYSGQNAE